ncbi:hypothetical protein M0534_06910 [Methylonatrum kenyense]|uniref:hypothetical protein n=1 Tax=Methylonatrum kenyense TaxID=455253 RepID=UPI0020C0CB16|nr:hypothetical protein [Methylonatrum kenyense]MCK8516053.1 hypothetical protein [Methylonatrum kenyense]
MAPFPGSATRPGRTSGILAGQRLSTLLAALATRLLWLLLFIRRLVRHDTRSRLVAAQLFARHRLPTTAFPGGGFRP